jgi:hypothetical protein
MHIVHMCLKQAILGMQTTLRRPTLHLFDHIACHHKARVAVMVGAPRTELEGQLEKATQADDICHADVALHQSY